MFLGCSTGTAGGAISWENAAGARTADASAMALTKLKPYFFIKRHLCWNTPEGDQPSLSCFTCKDIAAILFRQRNEFLIIARHFREGLRLPVSLGLLDAFRP